MQLALVGGTPARGSPIKTTVTTSDQVRNRVMALLGTGQLSNYYNGPWARRFEEAFARYHGPGSHAVAVNSGTSALHLAVSAAGIGPGDEVIVPALCFVAAATAIVQNGAIPIICDAEPNSLTLDVALAESLVGPKTKAIVAVHFWGYPANCDALRDLCERRQLCLIEDCAQAPGASTSGGLVGTFGRFATYAFSVRKHIACGEGGVVTSRTPEDHDRLRRLSNYGKGPEWDDYDFLGYSYRMAEFPSVVALDGLARLDQEIAARRLAGHHYIDLVKGSGLHVVTEPAWGSSVFFKCPLLLPSDAEDLRPRLVEAISAENVSCRVPHRPLFAIPWLEDHLRARRAYRGAAECPVAASHHRRLFEIETGPNLPLEEAQVTGTALMKVWSALRGTSPRTGFTAP